MRLVVYHGTRRARTILREGFHASGSGEFGPGIYLSEDPGTAAFYALRVASGPEPPTVLRAVVTLHKPFVVRKVDWIELTARRTPRTVQRRLRREGYDGILGGELVDYRRQIIAFEPRAIAEGSVAVHEVLG